MNKICIDTDHTMKPKIFTIWPFPESLPKRTWSSGAGPLCISLDPK